MKHSIKTLAALFAVLAAAGCKTEEGVAVIIPQDYICTNDILKQSFTLKPGDSFYYFTGNRTIPYYELGRKEENIKRDGAITVKTTTETTIKLYEQDRWDCRDNTGTQASYRDFPVDNKSKYYKINNH